MLCSEKNSHTTPELALESRISGNEVLVAEAPFDVAPPASTSQLQTNKRELETAPFPDVRHDLAQALAWLEPHALAWGRKADLPFLSRFAEDLQGSLLSVNNDLNGASLIRVKKRLGRQGYGAVDIPIELGGQGRPSLIQGMVQFLCGYCDLDLRDAAHVGHGRIVVNEASVEGSAKWTKALLSGVLCGVAMTESHGGTGIRRIRTTLSRRMGGGYVLTGEKCWVSRINEAEVLVVLARVAGTEQIAAVLVDQALSGITRLMNKPFGLAGWSWGKVCFENVSVEQTDVLGIASGLDIVRTHFRYYRPMVAATCLGAAARVVDEVRENLLGRLQRKEIVAPRDSALEKLGWARARLDGALAQALTAIRLVEIGHGDQDAISSGTKAAVIDAAYEVASVIALLTGARHLQAHSSIAKQLRDLRGYLCADGIHDELYRSAGRSLLSRHF